jgi:hypothetical protein
MLLAEYAITPDVFDATCYASEELCAARLETIREAMLNESIVRDLRNGAWSQLFRKDHRPWHRRGKELARKLALQNRLITCAPQLAAEPAADSEWCDEALATHGLEPLAGIIVTDTISGGYAGNPLVAGIDRLGGTAWWSGRSHTITHIFVGRSHRQTQVLDKPSPTSVEAVRAAACKPLICRNRRTYG